MTVIDVEAAALTMTEARVRDIWMEALQLADVPVDVGFLAAGGDSIAAMLCLNAVRTAFGVELAIDEFLAADMTVRAVAAHVDGAPAGGGL